MLGCFLSPQITILSFLHIVKSDSVPDSAILTYVCSISSLCGVQPTALEFFAGIGLARIGLEAAGFAVRWANDIEADKYALYHGHFGHTPGHRYDVGDIAEVSADQLPRRTSLAWVSSPCTDLSVAGNRDGLNGAQSSAFWHVIRLLHDLDEDKPYTVVLENVLGLASSHGGSDLRAAIRAFNSLGYSVDVLTLDAKRFIPQSRPRLFVIGVLDNMVIHRDTNTALRPSWLQWVFDDPELITHQAHLPSPPLGTVFGLSDIVEDLPLDDARWWDRERTRRFVDSLSGIQRDRVDALQASLWPQYRTAYRRTRAGRAVWEVRQDDIAGCLRTARGGSSKQALVRLGNGDLHIRWMTPREYARLMGADDYVLNGARPNQALFGFGDAVAVPVVQWLAQHYLMPLITGSSMHKELLVKV